jgi:hypothetical protein
LLSGLISTWILRSCSSSVIKLDTVSTSPFWKNKGLSFQLVFDTM